MNWHEKLKFARKGLNLSLRQVESMTGLSNPYLCQLENGQIKEPSFFKMMALIKLYNLEVADFIVDEVIINGVKINAPQFIESLERASKESEKAIQEIRDSMRVDSETMNKPITI